MNFVDSGQEDDSNLLTSEHDVISGVLREELLAPRSRWLKRWRILHGHMEI